MIFYWITDLCFVTPRIACAYLQKEFGIKLSQEGLEEAADESVTIKGVRISRTQQKRALLKNFRALESGNNDFIY